MTRITALELENFQSIKDRMRIDFAPITLLYGPNSAGKSAVFDALDLIECIWDPTKFDQQLAEQMVDRWARREGGKRLPIYLAVEFKYRVEDSFTDTVWNNPSNWECKKTRAESASFFFSEDTFDDDPELFARFEDTTVKLSLQITEIDDDDLEQQVATISYISISIPEETIFEYGQLISPTETTSDENIPKRLMHLRWEGRDATVSGNTPFYNPSLWVFGSQNDRLKENKKGSSYKFSLYVPGLSLLGVSPIGSMRSVEIDAAATMFRDNVSDIFFYFGSLIGALFRISAPVVKADRRVPAPDEALFVIDFKREGWWDSKDRFSASSPAKLLSTQSRHKDPHYDLIAKASHALMLQKASVADFWGDSHSEKFISGDSRIKSLIHHIEGVNEHLESHLFREKLYKVECASILMVPLDLEEDDLRGYYMLAQPAAVRIYLRDGEGRKLELQDVGSGIPFVLPVLYSAVYGALSRMQQPELHLHPALQADLADVFLSESLKDKDRLFIIETHSEHLLLRLLRRIRDTEKGAQSADALPMTPSDIAIYYFDPQVTGGTYAIKQAVTPLGDFYHDWPRGFFADRDKDLFNE